MKISILLPYKENFSPDYPGAVSIYVKDTTKASKFKNKIFIYGSTNYKRKLLKNYINLPFNKSALALYDWAPIAEELKTLDRKIVLNSMILKWDNIKEEFEKLINF